jgi:hypothetical protein
MGNLNAEKIFRETRAWTGVALMRRARRLIELEEW